METNVNVDELKDLGQKMADHTKRVMGIQNKYEKAMMLSEVAEKSDLSLLDEDGKLWDIKDSIGEEYEKLQIFVKIAIKNCLENCRDEFETITGRKAVNPEPEQEPEPEHDDGKETESAPGSAAMVEEQKSKPKKKNPIDGNEVINMHLSGMTNKEIAKKVGISAARVSQILKMAREKGIL